LLTAATAIQIAIALIVLTRPSRDDVESAERARRATVSVPSGDEQSAAPARTLPFAVRKEGFYRRGAAGSRPRGRKVGGSPSRKVDRPKPRLIPNPPPPLQRATTVATANNPPPPSSETTNAAGRPPPQTVARNAAGGEDEDDDDEEEEDDEGDDDDGGDDDDDDGGGGEDDD
jgi:hypothetical protein